MNDKYILNDKGEPVPEPDPIKWGQWFEHSSRPFKRRVKREKVGNYEVSTVFLGLDHKFGGEGPPVLWETMVFGEGDLSQDMKRCSGTREQAESMHEEMVKNVKASLRKNAKTMSDTEDNSEFKIEKGIPITRPLNGPGSGSKYPFKELEIGDSFLVPNKTTNAFAASVSYWGRRLKRKFTSRATEGGVRVWRIK